MRAICIAIAALALAACDEGLEQPERQAEADTAVLDPMEGTAGQYDSRREWMLEDVALLGVGRERAREAARAYAVNAVPGAQVRGMATLAITGNLYLVSVDLAFGGQDQEIDLIARRYFDDEGETYWKAHPLTAELAGAITGYETRALQQKSLDTPLERE